MLLAKVVGATSKMIGSGLVRRDACCNAIQRLKMHINIIFGLMCHSSPVSILSYFGFIPIVRLILLLSISVVDGSSTFQLLHGMNKLGLLWMHWHVHGMQTRAAMLGGALVGKWDGKHDSP